MGVNLGTRYGSECDLNRSNIHGKSKWAKSYLDSFEKHELRKRSHILCIVYHSIDAKSFMRSLPKWMFNCMLSTLKTDAVECGLQYRT
jgi:hypothetical protein